MTVAAAPVDAKPARRSVRELLRRLRPYSRPQRRYVVYVFIGLLAGLPLAWLHPWLVKRVFDEAIPRGDERLLIEIFVAFVLVTGAEAWLAFGRAAATTLLHHRLTHRLRLDLFRGFQRLALGALKRRAAGAWQARLADDVQNLGGVTGDFFANGAAAVVSLLVTAAILVVFVDAPLAIASIAGGLVLFGIQWGFSKPLRKKSEAVREGVEKTLETLHEAIAGAATVRAAAAEPREGRRHAVALAAAWRASLKRDFFGIWSGHPSVALGGLFPAAIMVFGAKRILDGAMTTGDLFAAFGLLGQLFTAVRTLAALNPSLQASLAAFDRIVDVLDEATTEAQPTGAFAPATIRGDVAFENVVFGYGDATLPDRKPVLRDVSFDVRAGTTVALVGRSGAGKTTLVSLLCRHYEPWSGRILIDGRPLSDYDVRELRKRVGVVPQDVFVFNRSAAENVAYGKPDATREEIEAALKAADAFDFVAATPEGLDTVLGERGFRLSGGQRQRLAVARELLRDPPIVVLDEATSWLDAETEDRVRASFDRLLKGRTCFIVAHRLATVRRADVILVLDEGRLVDRGTHEELLARGGLYADLARRQFLDA
jgi:ABC-type multidrug transport system fused ATPase/permease subunit